MNDISPLQNGFNINVTMSSREIAEWVKLENFQEDKPFSEIVYLIHCGGQVKIGRSLRPKQRVTEVLSIAGRKPDAIWLLAGKYDAVNAENKLHKAFKANRDVGEWFNVEPKEVMAHSMKMAIYQHQKKQKRSADEIFEALMNHFDPKGRRQA